MGGSGQTRPHVPQLTGSLASFSQPLGHIVSPIAHALQSVPATLHPDGQVVIVLWHAPPAAHIAAESRTPFAQVWAAPHDVPTGLSPLATHAELPVEHEVIPNLQGSDGVHAVPAVHDTQLPALQTWFVPQLAPSATGVPASWQLELPVAQVRVPLWHGLLGAQAPPEVQALQVPSLQT